jgi:predicted transcriptional regulator
MHFSIARHHHVSHRRSAIIGHVWHQIRGDDAAKLFSKTRVRGLPVVNKAGTMIGIIAMDHLGMLLGNEMGHIASGPTRSLKQAFA